ncbi:MobF family relaxase [Mycobacteroides abscessus subsp. abscessus]|uniref:MobF family relaxase n=1 Tax=Mycobacteroides abscessus TaxID=36809 RepID=UPI00266CD5A4|nr:MobF family relaxase [Mycobacteroides abscessus]MDO3013296.1 MobF family relaxase [Mycobacteroides abscessus subsp. abscessus]
MMGLHKLTAGDGYMYLIRQVAASDDTARGKSSLADYYSEKGEAPGRWVGSGLAALGQPVSRDPNDPLVAELWSVAAGSEVNEQQMKALFGEGLHPNADKITKHLTGKGLGHKGAIAAARLGRPFRINTTETEFVERLKEVYATYNLTIDADENAAIAPDIKAQLRTSLGRDMFTEQHGRPPADDRELTGYIARQTRSQTTAVAGFDLTFTPVKSVSALWAIAPRPIAAKIQACHDEAVAATLAYIERNAAFSRMGADGVEQVNTTGLIGAAFTHRDSRAGDPNLHTHVAISNKVCALGPDGIPRWLALDGEPLYKIKVSASEFYNTYMEMATMRDVHVRFEEDGKVDRNGKRPVREIIGMPADLNTLWSSRTAAILNKVAELAKAFQQEHSREPTVVEFLALSQQANLATRQDKHEPRSEAEQRQAWQTQAVEVLGSGRAVTKLITTVTGHGRHRTTKVNARWISEQAEAVIRTVSHHRATWQINHIRAEAQRRMRYTDHVADLAVADAVVDAALSKLSVAISRHADTEMNEPSALRRADGTSVYKRHDSTVYTSPAILAAEDRIIAAAKMTGGRVVDEESIGIALLEAHAQNGISLNPGQTEMVRKMATSGARLQLALAPAGTGKTTAMAALSAAWRNTGGNVIGLAPTAVAADVLGEDLGADSDTLAKCVQLTGRIPGPPAPLNDPARKWFRRINSHTLIIIDEAGMAATEDLDIVIDYALSKGASVRMIGDDRQLASVSAGGVLRDIAQVVAVLTLTTVVRFGDTERGRAEGAASLALREGDPAAIGFYIDHDRVHVGADDTAADMAYLAWAADRDAGLDSILIAATNPRVAELNERARLDRLKRENTRVGRTTTLSDGLTASAGDWIATRSNARWLRTESGKWVKNGQRWRIVRVGRDGSLTVRPLRGKSTKDIRLPADYIAEHVTLGYASTINTNQGTTADISRIVGSDELNREQLYVALTRGRKENHVYFSTSEADPHRILTEKAVRPPTAVDILTTILGRVGAQLSAHSAIEAEEDPAARLHGVTAMYTDALTAGALHIAGPAVIAAIDAAATTVPDVANLTDSEAWPVLRRTLALLSLEGVDPVAALHHAASAPLGNASDPAAVLDSRLHAHHDKPGPLLWLTAAPDVLATHPTWGPYLASRAALVTELAHKVRAEALSWDAAHTPEWARPIPETQRKLAAEIAVFRASHNVDEADTRVTGPAQHRTRSAAVQRMIHNRLDEAITREKPGAARWRPLAETLAPRITLDPYWPTLAGKLDDAARAGADIPTLLAEAIDNHGPLPDELPAAAMWWRLSGPLSIPTLHHAGSTLRPAWTTDLHHLLGTPIADIVMADTYWPSLVAAVAASGWPPADMLTAAVEHIHDIAHTEIVRPDEYARILTYRVELLSHQPDRNIPHPAETAEAATTLDGLINEADLYDALDDEQLPPDLEHYSESFADDDLSGRDFDDLPAARPSSAPVLIDIPALRARRDAARARLAALRQAILSTTGGPAEQAIAADIAAMRGQFDDQRAHHHALAHAHAEWISAVSGAEAHHRLLDRLTEAADEAAGLGDDAGARSYRDYHAILSAQTTAVDDAAVTADERHQQAYADLLEYVGGADKIVTAHDIEQHRLTAIQADTAALIAARHEAVELDNQLFRAEAAAARSFAEHTRTHSAAAADTFAVSATVDLDALRAEVDFLEAASAKSFAAAHDYRSRPEATTAFTNIDHDTRDALLSILAGDNAIQVLHLHADADKAAVLQAIAAATDDAGHKVLALPGSADAGLYHAEHPYAPGAHRVTDRLNALPPGSVVIVDDADHLGVAQLQSLAANAETTNTKLVLVTGTTPGTSRDVLNAAHKHLPWSQTVGTPEPGHQVPDTAIDRAQRSLDTSTPDVRDAANELLERHAELQRDRQMASSRARGAAADRTREQDRGLEL